MHRLGFIESGSVAMVIILAVPFRLITRAVSANSSVFVLPPGRWGLVLIGSIWYCSFIGNSGLAECVRVRLLDYGNSAGNRILLDVVVAWKYGIEMEV